MTDNLGPDDADNTVASDELAGYVMARVKRWRETRDANYKEKWNKYYAIWRGEWTQELKGKQAERSRIITPATQQATDQTVAEMVEATFGRGNWLDIDDDDAAPQPQPGQQMQPPQPMGPPGQPGQPPQQQQAPPPPNPVQQTHDNLIADLELYNVQSAIVDTYYNGAIYGTGIAKRLTDTKVRYHITQGPMGPQETQSLKYCVMWEAVPPYNFVIDTSATNIEDAHGVAHETVRPIHEVKAKQQKGEYFKGDIGIASSYTNSGALKMSAGMSSYETDPVDGVYITEYHGLAPKRLIESLKAKKPGKDMSDVAVDPEDVSPEDEELVESIITIANGSKTLKAVENPILGKSRGFVAYQHHKAPNRFWGIGQPEKAFNSQSALDSEVRARQDTLALTTYPSVTADATRLPRNLNLTVVPGKVFLTNGRGSEIIEPIKFGDVSQTNFQNAQDLERMVQMATGAEDPTKSVNNNPRMEAASGASMAQAPYIKRAKLTMQNVDTDFLSPLAKKTLEAYMTFDTERYPVMYNYRVKSSVSIMAREFEQAQMTNLLSVLPDGSPAHNIVLKGIIENYSGPSKDSMMQAVEAMNNPDPQQQQIQQLQQQLQMQTMQATLAKLQAEVKELATSSDVNVSVAKLNAVKAQMEPLNAQIQVAQTKIEAHKTDIQQQQVHVSREKTKVDAATKLHVAHKQMQAAKEKSQSNATNT